MWRSCLACLGVIAVSSVNAAPPLPACPTLDDANERTQARAKVLIEEFDKRLQANAAFSTAEVRRWLAAGDSTNFYIALASVLGARAKEESRIWLVQRLSKKICDQTKQSAGYFSNVCEVVGQPGQYPGPSLGLIRTRLRQDIYALPACYLYRRDPNSSGYLSIFDLPVAGQNPDTGIDPYLVEAALVAVYVYSKENPSSDAADAPTLEPLPAKAQLAKLLVAAAYAKFAGAKPFSKDATATCNPDDTQLKHALQALQTRLESTNAADRSVEAILRTLHDELTGWCTTGAKQLKTVGDIYLQAVKGDYYEAAFAASAALLCKTEEDRAGAMCSKLPLLAEVASAKTQDDMEAALDRVISPLGAWRRKQSERVFSLNAMAGVAAGIESLEHDGESASHSTVGLFMPVGLEVSWPQPKWGIFRSVAVGATMLDLGAVVSYSDNDKLQGGDTSTAANADWSSLASPGVYVAFGFRDSPFRIGLSASRTPQLRSVDFDDGVEKNVDSTRYMLFVTVDVTLLSF